MLELDRRAGAIARSDRGLEDLCLAFDGLLRRVVPYAVAAWSTHDPATGLFTSCTMSGLPKDPAREAALFRHEFVEGEPGAFPTMIADGATSAVLSRLTDGDLARAGRWRELLAGFGVTDELRVLFWSADRPWGSATLYRQDGVFERPEITRVETVARHVGDGLRLALLRAAASRPQAVSEPPGVLEVRPGGHVRALTRPARRWLEVGGDNLRTTATATASALRGRPDWAGATTRLQLADGRVLSLHAAHAIDDAGAVAVIVDQARPVEVASMLVEAYGLTPRQRDVLGLLLLGRSMTQIARELDISEHTANDHRKAVYRRIGVSSRSELAALLQAEHYDPRSRRGAAPSPYGGFLE